MQNPLPNGNFPEARATIQAYIDGIYSAREVDARLASYGWPEAWITDALEMPNFTLDIIEGCE